MYRKNAWKKYGEDLSPVMNYAEGYKQFISFGKTERLVARESEELLRKAGFILQGNGIKRDIKAKSP